MACVPSLRTETPGQEGERSSPDPGDSPADSTACAGLMPKGFCNRTVASARPRQVDDLAAVAVLPSRRAERRWRLRCGGSAAKSRAFPRHAYGTPAPRPPLTPTGTAGPTATSRQGPPLTPSSPLTRPNKDGTTLRRTMKPPVRAPKTVRRRSRARTFTSVAVAAGQSSNMLPDLLKQAVEHRWQSLALTGALRRSCGLLRALILLPSRSRPQHGTQAKGGSWILHGGEEICLVEAIAVQIDAAIERASAGGLPRTNRCCSDPCRPSASGRLVPVPGGGCAAELRRVSEAHPVEMSPSKGLRSRLRRALPHLALTSGNVLAGDRSGHALAQVGSPRDMSLSTVDGVSRTGARQQHAFQVCAPAFTGVRHRP